MVASKLFELPLIDELEYKVFDTYQRNAPRAYQPSGVRIVDIDDQSLATLGQWPWSRATLAELTNKLYAGGAAVVAFDIIFPEEDRTAPKHIVPIWGDSSLQHVITELPDPDALFTKALEDKPAVAAIMLGAHDQNPYEYNKASVLVRGEVPGDAIKTFDGMVASLPAFNKAALGVGSINSIPERDGVLRRVPLFLRYHDQLYPNLGLEALRLATGNDRYVLNANAGIESVQLGDMTIPVDENGMFWVYYSHSDPDRYVPAYKIMDGTFDREKIDGHIIIIGTSAAGLKDLRATPHDVALPGVEVHAQVIEQILRGEYLNRPNWIFGVEVSGLIVLGLALILLVRRAGALVGFLGMLLLITLVIGVSWYAFITWHLLINPVTAVITAVLMYLFESARRFLQTEQERQEIRDAFGLYLSPELVNKAVANPERLKLGGENRELTVMFTDIRDFSAYSEGRDPEELTQFINDFLTPMTDVILGAQGTIDKYIGDCIMAFWNAPLDVAQHAKQAARAALAMRAALAEFNRQLAETHADLPPVRVGMGLNTGICCVGNLGSKSRFNYSALGNPVDMASRLEGQSKYYGIDLVVGEPTYAQLAGFATVELDVVRVKGKKNAMHVYTLLGDETFAAKPEYMALMVLHQKMLNAYRKREWTHAMNYLEEASAMGFSPLTGPYALYRKRIEDFIANPPPADWDGVYTATFK